MTIININNFSVAIAPQQPLSALTSNSSTAGTVHDTVLNGPIKALNKAYSCLVLFYKNNVSLTVRRRFTQIHSGLSKGGEFLSSAYYALIPLISLLRNTLLSGEKALRSSKRLIQVAKKTRIFSVIYIPISLVGTIKGFVGFSLSSKNNKWGDSAEHAFRILANLGDLCESTAMFIEGLKAVKFVEGSVTLTTVTTYLLGIGTILSIATIGLYSKFIYESGQLRNRIDKLFENADHDKFNEIVNEFDTLSDAHLARRVGVADGKKLKTYMSKINKTEDLEGKQNTVNALKERIQSNNLGRYLKITATVISLIAIAILMFSPIAPVGYALLALSSAIGIGVLVMNYKAEKKLNAFFQEMT